MPKINFEVGKVDIQTTWPFPVESEKPKPAVKKPTAKKIVKKYEKIVKKTAK